MSDYTKRYLFTVGFKGRPRRGLLWRKDVYREWFLFAKLSGKYPDEFGNLDEFKNFEDWWRHPEYGFELFCEPEEQPPIIALPDDSVSVDGRLILSIDLDTPTEQLVHRFKSLMKKKQKGKTFKIVSRARFQPSRPQQYIKVQKLERWRIVYSLMQQGMTRGEIYYKLSQTKSSYATLEFREKKDRVKPFMYFDRGWSDDGKQLIKGESSDPLRMVTRDRAECEKVIKNVRKGIFP